MALSNARSDSEELRLTADPSLHAQFPIESASARLTRVCKCALRPLLGLELVRRQIECVRLVRGRVRHVYRTQAGVGDRGGDGTQAQEDLGEVAAHGGGKERRRWLQYLPSDRDLRPAASRMPRAARVDRSPWTGVVALFSRTNGSGAGSRFFRAKRRLCFPRRPSSRCPSCSAAGGGQRYARPSRGRRRIRRTRAVVPQPWR